MWGSLRLAPTIVYVKVWKTLRNHCVPGHSSTRSRATHTLSAHSKIGGSKLSICMRENHLRQLKMVATRIITHVASYLASIPVREQFCPPTRIQLLNTNKTSDNNPPAMSVDCGGPVLSKFMKGSPGKMPKNSSCTEMLVWSSQIDFNPSMALK